MDVENIEDTQNHGGYSELWMMYYTTAINIKVVKDDPGYKKAVYFSTKDFQFLFQCNSVGDYIF